jgi:hypothetical protein
MTDASGRGASGGAWRFIAVGLLVAAVAGGYIVYRAARGRNTTVTYHPSTAPASRPADAQTRESTSKPADDEPDRPTTTFVQVVRATYPKYTTTRPLDIPLRELSEAARITLKDPVYLGPSYRADLWITRNDGLGTADALKHATDPDEYPQVHVLPERVRFVHWNPGEKNTWTPFLVSERPDGSLEVVSAARREPIAGDRKYDWARANSWDNRIVVPSERGVSIFRFEPAVAEDYRELIPGNVGGTHAKPQALLDYQGLVAWVPAENNMRGSRGAARYVDDKWVDLGPEQGWPEQILQLVPLRDGSVLQIVPNAEGSVRLTVVTLFNANVNEGAITSLVEQLSDPDSDRREAAFKELTQYGPGIFPVIEKLAADQPPEARARLRSLMRSQVSPTLGGMTLLGERLQPVSRHNDGGVIFFAAGGVSIPRESSEPARRVPAWLSVRPGRAAEVLDELFVNELQPGKCQILTAGNNEWVVTGDAPGPRRWVGNGFVPVLKKEEAEFGELVGIDRRGRWLFRKPEKADGETLVLDPTLPDPTPRLPMWEYTTARAFGWDQDNWPTIRREGGDWSLHENGWRLLDEKKNQRLTTEVPPLKWKATTRPATTTTRSTTSPADIIDEDAILVTDDGTRYYDGLKTLRILSPDGTITAWPLPAAATGSGTPTLLRTSNGILFLFNQPGRVLRIRPTPDESEPFTVEATFTRKIPSIEKPRRIWLDPAGRIVVADARRLVIFFPQGFIPPRIRDMMPLEKDEDAEP